MNHYVPRKCTVLCQRLCRRWYRGGDEIPGAHESALGLKSVGYEMDGKEVACEATNSVGTTRASITLNVECQSASFFCS